MNVFQMMNSMAEKREAVMLVIYAEIKKPSFAWNPSAWARVWHLRKKADKFHRRMEYYLAEDQFQECVKSELCFTEQMAKMNRGSPKWLKFQKRRNLNRRDMACILKFMYTHEE